MTRLILIRHGETDYNLQNRYCGFSNPCLNDKGISQSRSLAMRLSDYKIDRVYSSDLKRALQSAKIIFKNYHIEEMADFREMNFGIFEGLKYEEIIKKYPEIYQEWIDNPMCTRVPEGEGLKELTRRVIEQVDRIISQYKDKTIAIVTHGGPIRKILCTSLGYGMDMFWQIEQDIAALNIIEYSKELIPAIIKMNDTSHLLLKKKVVI